MKRQLSYIYGIFLVIFALYAILSAGGVVFSDYRPSDILTATALVSFGISLLESAGHKL